MHKRVPVSAMLTYCKLPHCPGATGACRRGILWGLEPHRRHLQRYDSIVAPRMMQSLPKPR